MATSLVPPSGSSLVPVPPDPDLEAALVGLVADGTLSAEQAHAVRAARAGVAIGARPRRDTAAAPAAPAVHHNPLPEIVGYVGAALVASALLNLVLQSWEGWSDTTRLILVTTGTVALYVAGLAVGGAAGWRRGLADGPASRRRLVALLLAIGAMFAGLTTVVALMALGQGEAVWLVLASGCVAFTAAALGAWFVRGVLSTLSVAAGSVWLVAGIFVAFGAPEAAWWTPLAILAVGALWLALAPRLLTLPVLSEALGWAFMLQVLMSFALWAPPLAEEGYDPMSGDAFLQAMQTQAWVARGVLILLAIVGMLVFLRGGRWPWAAGGVAAAVIVTLAIGGQTLNWIFALLASGVILLLLSAILIVVRRRGDRRRAEAARTPPVVPVA